MGTSLDPGTSRPAEMTRASIQSRSSLDQKYLDSSSETRFRRFRKARDEFEKLRYPCTCVALYA